MNTNELLITLNNASQDELTGLPGIGPVLADRILKDRPFASLEAAQAVKGISSRLLEQLIETPAAELEPVHVPDTQSADEAPEESQLEDSKDVLGEIEQAPKTVTDEGLAVVEETVGKQDQAARQAMGTLPEKNEQVSKTRGLLWTILISSAITALISILLTLAVLGGINGSLSFATDAQYRTVQLDHSQLTTQVNSLQQDLDSLRGRVDTLEGLGERTVTLEKAQQQLTADLEVVGQQVTAMQTEATALNEKVSQQEERTLRFETFLQELQTLLGNLVGPQGE